MKTCLGCGESKPLDDFHRDKNKPDGHRARCRTCLSAAARLDRERDPESARRRATENSRKWREKHPGYYREWHQKHLEKRRAEARDLMRRSRLENPEAERARKQRYRAANAEAVAKRERERTYARRARQPHSPVLAQLMAELLQQPCAYCGATESITIDHIVPHARGGKHEASNLAAACLPCNASKNDRLLSEWTGRLAAA